MLDRIVRRIAELPDRTSPEDWPEAMLVTADELCDILRDELVRAVPPAMPPADELMEALKSEGQKDAWIEMLSDALRRVVIGVCEAPVDWEGSVADALDLIQARLTRDDVRLAHAAEQEPQQMKCLTCGHEHYFESDEAGFDSADTIPWGACKTCACKVPNYRPAQIGVNDVVNAQKLAEPSSAALEAWIRSNHDKAKDEHGRGTLGHDGAFESCPYPVCASCRPASLSDAPKPTYRSAEWDILEAMRVYGGGFVQQLAILYRQADAENKRTIEAAFRKYFINYDEIAAMKAAQE